MQSPDKPSVAEKIRAHRLKKQAAAASESVPVPVTGTVIRIPTPNPNRTAYKPEYCDRAIAYFEEAWQREEAGQGSKSILVSTTKTTEIGEPKEEDDPAEGKRKKRGGHKRPRQQNGASYSQRDEVRYAWQNMPMIEGFAREIGVSAVTIAKWRHQYPNFEDAIQRCKDIQAMILTNRTLNKQIDPQSAVFLLTNITWMRSRTEVTGADGAALNPPAELRSVPIDALERELAMLRESKARLLALAAPESEGGSKS